MGWPALPRVVVNDEDALEARAIALEFEKAVAHVRPGRK